MNTVRRIITVVSAVLATAGSCVFAYNDGSNYVRTRTFLTEEGDSARSRVSTVYCDGMGREVLTVAGVPGSMTAMRSDYDLRGNLWRKWLPVPGDASCLSKHVYENSARAMYGAGEIAYTTYGYEDTGRNRQTSEVGPGLHWQGKEVSKSFHRNAEPGTGTYKAPYICPLLLVDAAGTVTVNGAYKEATLRVTETIDEDGMKVLEFENRAGKVVLRRVIGTDGLTADTRFVYDIRGDLRYVISPEGSQRLPAAGAVDQDILDDYAQSYNYDFIHRCIRKKLPGCEATEYVYDKFGNLIFSADGEQRARSEWTVIKYDNKMRPAVKGISKLPGQTRQSLQTAYGDTALVETFNPGFNTMEYELQYTNTSGPSDFTPYMAWYYDNYNFIQSPAQAIKAQFEAVSDGTYTAMGLCTGTAMINASNETYYRAVKYDARKNVTMTCLWDCYMQQTRYTESTVYDFVGQPVTRTEEKAAMAEGMVMSADNIEWQYTYDDLGRLTEQTLSVNGGAPFTVSIAQYDAIGRMQNEWRGAEVSYGYDIRGHLSQISSDIYNETAGYGASPFNQQTPSFKFLNYTTESWGGAKPYALSMAYSYDGLGRMKNAESQGDDDGPRLCETVDVDLDANVVGVMRRYNVLLAQDAAMTMDGGKVVAVNDASAPYYADYVGRFPDGSYTLAYDRNGRLTTDETRQIKAITYHKYVDRPNRITMDNGDYAVSNYLPDGTLTRRAFYSKRIETVTKVNADGDTIVRNVTRTTSNIHDYMGSFWTMRGETAAKRVLTPTGYVDLTTGKRYWYLTNRQGSTMAVVDETGAVVQRNGYYPSGTPFVLPSEIGTTPAPSMTAVTDQLHIGNRWLSHSGLNMYDNTARLHDPLLMRFAAPDPLADKYPDFSPWSHCATNSINAVDPDGNVIIFVGGMHFGDGGKKSYWEGVDSTIKKRFQDYSARYYDGSLGGAENTACSGVLTGNLNPMMRFAAGMAIGMRDAKAIYDGLKINETIKLVSHSMGAAYLKGFAASLLSYAAENKIDHKIVVEADLAPYQPLLQAGNEKLKNKTVTISHWNDMIAGPSFMPNATNHRTRRDKFSIWPTVEHSVKSFKGEIEDYLPAFKFKNGGEYKKWEENGSK